VTVVEGNVDHATGARVATGLADLAGRSGVSPVTPVHEGTGTAAREPAAAWRAALAARRRDPLAAARWSGVAAALGPRPGGPDAVTALVDLVTGATGAPDRLTLVATGPLTNLAAAERRHPGLLRRCARVVVLGGAFTGPLGVRELNFAMDPEAADTVLGAGAAVTLVPLDVTRRLWLTADDVAALRRAPSPLVRHLVATAAPWVEWIGRSRGWPGANPHDVVAVAVAVDPALARRERVPVAVELTGELTRSRPVRLPDEAAGPAPTDRGRPPIEVVTDVDRDRLMALFHDRLGRFGGEGRPDRRGGRPDRRSDRPDWRAGRPDRRMDG
jgi:inosine-uridine nucleoside N-ribohydrolase